MAAWQLAATVACLWLPVHLHVTRSSWTGLSGWMTSLRRLFVQEDALKHMRVEQEMENLRQQNCKWFCTCLPHVLFVVFIGFLHKLMMSPGIDTITYACLVVICYLERVSISLFGLNLTGERMRYLGIFEHSLLLINIIGAGMGEAGKEARWQGLQTSSRFSVIYGFVDSSVTVPFQVLYSCAEVAATAYHSNANLETSILNQGVVCFFCILTSFVAELMIRGRIYAYLDSADAASLVSSFQGVLRGVCDGEVLLDSDLRVAQDSERLKHLLHTDVALTGRKFEHLLVDGERDRFREFIETSTGAFGLQSEDPACPLCLRVSFRGAAEMRVAADIYHVPVPGLFGSQEPYHLIAFTEDIDGRVPDAQEGSAAPPTRTSTSESNCSASAESARSSAAPFSPELEEMFLLVKVNTDLQDVVQVELNFRRQELEDPVSALQSGMPSLRRLVQPIEWEKVRSAVSSFARRASLEPNLPPKTMPGLNVQLPGQSGWLIADATIFPKNAEKVWLHLQGFRPAKAPQLRTTLDPIHEGHGRRPWVSKGAS